MCNLFSTIPSQAKGTGIGKYKRDKMLKMDFSEPAQTERMELILFAPKGNRTLRLFVDYCKLSAITIWDSYYIMCMEECINYLGDATIFSILDGNSGYWLVEVANKDR